MDVIRRSKDKYGIQQVGKKKHRIVKILKEYDNEKDAVNDMTKLLTGEITEQELIDSENK